MRFTLYHNPRCSKSREVLRLLRLQGHEPHIIHYLETPPSPAQLRDLLKKLGCGPREILRRREAPYREQGLDDDSLGEAVLLRVMSRYPILIERPIVVHGTRAVLGRPPERVTTLF